MENSLVNIINAQPIGKSVTTGTTILQSYISASGFHYQVGIRETAGLYILECFAEGTGCSFLNKIVVLYGENKQIIADIVFPQNTYYSREIAMESISVKLCRYFFEACKKENMSFSKDEIEQQVTDLLDRCYFSESRTAALQWAINVGIIKDSCNENKETI